MRHVAEQRVRKYLRHTLKPRPHRANRRIEPSAATVFVASRTNGWICLIRSVRGIRNVIQKTANTVAAAEIDARLVVIKACSLPAPRNIVLSPVRRRRQVPVGRRPENRVVIVATIEECGFGCGF